MFIKDAKVKLQNAEPHLVPAFRLGCWDGMQVERSAFLLPADLEESSVGSRPVLGPWALRS